MKVGTYNSGKNGTLQSFVYFSKHEHAHLFHKAPLQTGRVYLHQDGNMVVLRRALSDEVGSLAITAQPQGSAECAYRISVGGSRWASLGLGKQHKHRASHVKCRFDVHKSIPVLVASSIDLMCLEALDLDKPKERATEPLYKPEEHPPEPIRQVSCLKAKSDDPTKSLKELLDWVNDMAKETGAELFTDAGRLHARITTVI